MIELGEILSFQNREVLAVATALLLFLLMYIILLRFISNKGVTLVIALCVAFIAGWNLYTHEFYGFERTLAVVLYLVIAALFLKLIIAFITSLRR